jgi:hypothetical protein
VKIIGGAKVTMETMKLPTEKVTKENADAYMAANPNLAK